MTLVPTRPAPIRRRGKPVVTYDERQGPSVLPAADRHLVKRFSWGLTPALAAQVRAAGGGRAWFAKQLQPANVADAPGAAVNTWFPSMRLGPRQIFQNQEDEVQGSWEVAADLSRWTVGRRIASNRQLHEVMVDFWSNLLNVSLFHDDAVFWRMDYDRVIRKHALTTFEALLRATITHPAMGLYLDNAYSSKESPNENLGRELLELHTVGVDAGYTEDDVKASARMLTGYRVDLWWPSFRAFYDTSWHDTQPVQVMGFTHANRSADGRAATLAYLSYLAKHPATAQRLAHRLCVKFVSDQPTRAIVNAVARAYRASGTAIKPTLRALVDHPDFAAGAGKKVRTPTEDYVAAVRALGIRPQAPTTDESFANAMLWQYGEAGQPPYEWPAPNGYPEVDGAWASAGRVLTSFTIHRDLAARWWPTEQARFPSYASMLPPMPATLAQVIDHQALRMFGHKPSDAVRTGIAQLLGMPLTTRLTKDDALAYWTLRGILSSLLDSPMHLHR
ncbi:DUF1800 domain-containing protein [Nocardioides bizhenqiangii]|uniref:DUF1800 domain-containing protein n=1 Tax=Nocardioides bizhenqiangii TaxID=3095076 RepID=A0ABZ0ZP93_9ACTN|nr:DUF1800 domain-containing protein [Nocardioides sp. HM61]WQQ26047.1 DUF1800 domain-containing protein [Nocardioides sp. HM61]